MATPILGGTAFDFGAAAQAPAVQPQTTSTTASVRPLTNVEPSGDSVQLSEGAHVRLLSSQGDPVSEIVINTALSTQAVNSYLGVTQAQTPPVATNK
jgi:hypothetical protein